MGRWRWRRHQGWMLMLKLDGVNWVAKMTWKCSPIRPALGKSETLLLIVPLSMQENRAESITEPCFSSLSHSALDLPPRGFWCRDFRLCRSCMVLSTAIVVQAYQCGYATRRPDQATHTARLRFCVGLIFDNNPIHETCRMADGEADPHPTHYSLGWQSRHSINRPYIHTDVYCHNQCGFDLPT